MKGYKATDKDMKCLGFQYELGKWYEHEGELLECESGFHFCDHPSGPWAYYSGERTRIFEVEAKDVLDESSRPGADVKRVCRRIKLVREIEIKGNGNTGDWNTGDWNTGARNTGDWNTGARNTGNGNATNLSSGFFGAKEPKVISFDIQTNLTREQFIDRYPEYWDLAGELIESEPINYEKYVRIPGITKRKLNALHKKHIEARKR